ncbi:FecR family protein [Devosia sp. SD17-2]|uniref:FecR family protein n=1 Tax=Devosia sp. SD17-2 TaxID=2976459 RepID=UPI0023D8B12E|nr:FecR family protein [Devosia sp. SD17-2]WEJ31412.1 FecR family protein [Devosia sp. SD17-2]
MNRSLCTLVAVLFGATSIAYGADGTAVGVDPDAFARGGSAERILHVGADISLGEEIVTGPSGKVQIVFADETRLVVGPQSALLIESYLMAGDPNDKFAINALAGSFRFMSGNGPKSAYSIQTPTASIAVRGTKFDISVGDGQTDVLLFEGAVTVCTSGGVCQELSQFCDIASFGGGGAEKIGHGDRAHGAAGKKFNFARFPSTVMGDFRVSGATQCMSPPEPSSAPASLSAANSDEKVAAPKEPIKDGEDDNDGGSDNNGGGGDDDDDDDNNGGGSGHGGCGCGGHKNRN